MYSNTLLKKSLIFIVKRSRRLLRMESSSLSTSFMLSDSRSVAGASPRPCTISYKRLYTRDRAPVRCMAVGGTEKNQKASKLEASNPKQAVSVRKTTLLNGLFEAQLLISNGRSPIFCFLQESPGKFTSLANSLLLNVCIPSFYHHDINYNIISFCRLLLLTSIVIYHYH